MKHLALSALLALVSLPAFAAANVSVDNLIEVVIYLVILSLVFWVIWWFVGYVGVPEPFNKVIRVVIGLVALLVVVSLLLGMLTGSPIIRLR